MESLRGAPIEGAQPYLYYLYLDATFLDARWARKVENVSALVAYAVGPDSHHRLLGITLGPEESQDSLDLPRIGGRFSACVFSLLPRAFGVRSFRCAGGAGE